MPTPPKTRPARAATPVFFNHEALCRARLDLALTQEEAAAAAGIDVRTYRRYESGEVNDWARGFAVKHGSRRKILSRLADELGLAEEDLLIARGPIEPAKQAVSSSSAPGWEARWVHPLPRARHFVGRAALLDRLRQWHHDPRADAAVIALVALGGAGKTSVVERFVCGLGEGHHPAGVLVYSFYDEPRIEAFFEHALRYFVPSSPALAGERPDALIEALRGKAHLLVLDGLEVVQGSGAPGTTLGRVEDASLRRLITAAARAGGARFARILVTSRLPLVDLEAFEGEGSITVSLDDLSETESVDLLARWGLSGGAAELAPLASRVGRHALSVAMMGSYVGAFLGGDPARARSIDLAPAARDDASARRLLSVLSAYARALPEAERDLVARLSLFPSGATLDVLLAIAAAGGSVSGAMSALDAAGLRRSLGRLARLGLVFAARGGDRFGTHPFLAEYFQSILGVPAEHVHAVTRDALAARLDVHAPGATKRELLDAYEELCVYTRASGRAEEAFGIYQRALGGFSHLGLRLGEMRRGARVLMGFLKDRDPAQIQGDLPPRTRARLVYDLGLYQGALGDLDLAARCYRAHNEIARGEGSLAALCTGLRTLAYTERLRGALDDALALIDAAIEVSAAAGSRADLVRGLALRGRILHDLGRDEAAGEAFAEVRALGDEPFARRGLWEAERALELGRVEEARAATLRNVEVCRELGWAGHAAHGETLLGLAALAGEPPDLERARACSSAARRWTAGAGEVEMVLRCLTLEASIHRAAGDLPAARGAVEEGSRRAMESGFGLFAARFERLAGQLSAREDERAP